jgi:hypothetical protein
MRTTILTIPFVLLAGAAFAQDGPNSLAMSCAGAQRLVQERGAVVMWSGPNIFDRFVVGQAQCQRDEYPIPAWIPTQDQQDCLVGQRCKQVEGPMR